MFVCLYFVASCSCPFMSRKVADTHPSIGSSGVLRKPCSQHNKATLVTSTPLIPSYYIPYAAGHPSARLRFEFGDLIRWQSAPVLV